VPINNNVVYNIACLGLSAEPNRLRDLIDIDSVQCLVLAYKGQPFTRAIASKLPCKTSTADGAWTSSIAGPCSDISLSHGLASRLSRACCHLSALLQLSTASVPAKKNCARESLFFSCRPGILRCCDLLLTISDQSCQNLA